MKGFVQKPVKKYREKDLRESFTKPMWIGTILASMRFYTLNMEYYRNL
jgi:hypothetical protein